MKPFRHQMLARAIRNATSAANSHTGKKLVLSALASAGAVNAFAATHNIDAVDGFTTVVDLGNNTENVINNYKKGSVGVNVFNDFVVGESHTVNLQLGSDIDQLVNIVKSSTPEVHGILNSYQDGTLSGNVVFASSHGFLVGPSGIINVGHLSVKTPSQSELESWITDDGVNPVEFSDAGIDALSENTYAVSNSGLVTVSGKINTASGADIQANQVVIDASGVIIAGNAVQAAYVETAAVNVGDYSAPTELREEDGAIVIAAAGAAGASIAGDLLADGGITISADTIEIAATSTIDTRDAITANDVPTTALFIGDTLNLAGEVLASNVEIVADTSVTISGDITAIGSTGSDDDETEFVTGTIDIDAAVVNISGGANGVVLADTVDSAAALAAVSGDLLLVGNVDAYNMLDITGGRIEVSAGNRVSASDVELHSADINIHGELIADATADGSSGRVHLDGDAKYAHLNNISASVVKVSTGGDFYISDDASSLTTSAGDIVWEEGSGTLDLDFSLEVAAGNIQTAAATSVTAVNVSLAATGGVAVDGWLTADGGDSGTLGDIGLSGATLAFDFAKLSADSLSLATANNMIFAASASDAEYTAAGADDYKHLGAVDFDGELNLSAGAVTVTSGNSVTARHISIASDDTNIDGSLIADAGDGDGATFGSIALYRDADYEDLENLSYSELAIITDQNIVLSDDAASSAVTGAGAADIVWVDSNDFDFSGKKIRFEGGSLELTVDTQVSADDIELELGSFVIDGTLDASNSILLRSNISDSLDISSLNAAKLTLDSDDLTWTKALVYGGDLEFIADSITITSGGDISAASIILNADTIEVSGKLSTHKGSDTTLGDISLTGRDITLQNGSHLDTTDGDSATTDGDVKLSASQTTKVSYGEAAASSSITLAGEIDANNIDASAKSIAVSSYYQEIGATLGLQSVALLAGANFNYMYADADATLTVADTADLSAAGEIALATESHAMSEAMTVVAGAAPAGVALAGIYSRSDATSTTKILSGARVHAGGDLVVTAHNESYVASSAFVVQAQNSNKVVLAAAVGAADVDATAIIETGADLDAANLVVAAENLNRFYTSASVYGLAGTRYGLAVAVGDFHTNATAEMGADIGSSGDKVGDVTVVALDRTVEQRVHSGVSIGANKILRSVGSRLLKGMQSVQSGVSGMISSYLPAGAEISQDESRPGKVDWKGGLAFSLNLSDHEAYGYIGTNKSGQADAPEINASGNVLVAAATDLGTDNDAIAGGDGRGAVGGDQGGYRTSASTSVSSPKTRGGVSPSSEKSAAIALNFAINSGEAVAEIGDYVTISAQNVGVAAEQKMPIVSTYDRWESMSDVKSKLTGTGGLDSNILTTFATAGASADKEAYGGTINVVWNDIDTKAWIGDNVNITTTGSGSWSSAHTVNANSSTPGVFSDFEPFKTVTYSFDFDESVAVRAFNLIESANVAGNIGTLGLIPNSNGTNQSGKSIGGALDFVQQSANAVAGIGAATINASGDVSVIAESDERHFVVTPSSGMGTGTGFNGVITVLNSEALTHASVSNQAFLTANDLLVIADHQMGNWAASGAVNWSAGESAAGVAIAVNITQGDTKAFIGDNSEEEEKVSFKNGSQPAPTSPSAPVPSEHAIVARNVEVRGKSSGTNGSLAAAGALLTEDTGEPGFSDKLKGWLDDKTGGLVTTIAGALSGKQSGATSSSSSSNASVDNASGNGANDSASGDDSVAQVDANAASFAGAGSVTVSVSNLDAKAMIDGANIRAHSGSDEEVDVDVQALEKIVSASASGSAALNLSQAQSTPNSSAMAGAIAYQISFNDALAWVTDSDIGNAGNIAIQALHGGSLTSIGLGLAIDRPSQGGKSTSAGLSISGAQVRDGTSARMEGTTVSASGDGDNDFEVSAYNNTDIGVGGGTLYGGGQTGFGLAITFADIDDPANLIGNSNPDGNNILSSAYGEDVYSGKAVEAVVTRADDASSTNSQISNFDNIAISARGLQRIGIGAAGVGYNDNAENAMGYMGSFAIGSIKGDTKARLEHVTVEGADTIAVNVAGTKVGALDSILSGLGSSSVNQDYDFSGAAAIDNTEVHTSDDGTGSAYSYGSEGERIIAVAGVVQVGKSNLGLSYAHADVQTEKTAKIQYANINSSGNAASSVDVAARDEALLYTVAVGVGVATGKWSGIGSVAVNSLNNTVRAEIGDWDGLDSGTIYADSVSVLAQNDMDLVNVAGAVGISSGSGAAVGLAVALNLIGDSGHETRARIANTDLEVSGDITVKAASGASNDKNLLVGNAIGVGASTGSGGLAFAGAISVTDLDQTIQAAIKDIGDNSAGSASSTGGTVRVQAGDFTDSVATAWMGAGSGNGSAGGLALGVNRVDSDVTSEILGEDGSVDSTKLKAKHVYVQAERDNWLLTIDAGVAAAKQIAVAPSIGTGVVDGNVTARIADDANIEAYGNVGVEAKAKTENLVGSGAIGVGLDGGAGAVAISTAAEYGRTQAYIEGASVIARGQGATFGIYDGQLTGMSSLPDLSATAENAEGESEAVGNNVSIGNLTDAFGSQNMSEGTEQVTGLAVNATSFVKQRAITVSGAGSKNIAISANVATNVFESSTDAYIKNATINSGVSNQSGADVTVRASNHSYGLGVSAGIAVSAGSEGGGAGVGGFASNHMGKAVSAEIDNSTINADALTLEANSTQLSQAVSAGVAAGVGSTAGIGGAASVVINNLLGSTRAWLHDSTVTAGDVVVNAERRQDVNAAAGAAGLGTTVGVGFGLVVNIVGGDSSALIGNDLDDNGDTDSTLIQADTVTVDADRLESVNAYSLGAGLSTGYGVAAMINVTEFRGETRAAVHGFLHDNGTSGESADDYLTTRIVGQDGSSAATSVTVNAQDILAVDQETLGIGVGTTVGVGAVANVVLGRSQVYSEVVGSDIDASLLDIDATAQREANMISIAGAGGQYSAAVSIGVALFGQGDTTTADGTNAENEFDPSRQAANNVLASDTAAYNPHLSADDIAALESEGNLTIEQTSAPSTTTTTTTESGNSLKIGGESVVAARISGGEIDVDTLDVDALTMLHTYQALGAAQASTVGVAGAVGVTRLYDMTIATVDTNLQADNVTVDALVRDVSNADAAGEMKSFVLGLGGTSVVVNYNDVRSELRTVAGVTSALGSDSGDLSVSAQDTTELRVGDVDSGKPSDPADGSLSVNIGAAAVGVSIGFAQKNSDVDAWLGETGKLVDGYGNIFVDAQSSGLVKTTAFALSGGLLAGIQGVITDARDESNVNATVYGTISTGSGVVNIDAQAVPEVFARAYGVTVAGGGAMGGSFAYAIADTKAQAEAADGTYFDGEGTVEIRAETGDGSDENYVSADANAFAASGGLLLGFAGSEALARNSSQAVGKVGDGVRIPDNDFAVCARNTAVQYADADGYFVGYLAGGYNVSTAESKTSARVDFGQNPISGLLRTGDFILDAYNYDENQSYTTAGGGGYYAGSAAEANANSYNNSASNLAASVNIADWASGYTLIPVSGGEIRLSAAHQSQFFAATDSTTVSVVGGSGAVSNADVDNDVKVSLGQNVSFSGLDIDIEAENSALQIQTPAQSGFESSINAGAGGALNGSAGLSNQDLTGIDATVDIGAGAVLAISDLAWLDTAYDHAIYIDAHTRFYVYDSAVLKVGGALQGAGSESDVDATTHNRVNIGDNVLIYNPVGEIGIGTYTTGSATAQANTSVWAIAGVAGGVSDVDVNVTNTVDLGQGVVINAYGDIGIYAGRGSNYLYENQLTADARTNVYNWTAVPIPAGNKATADITLHNDVIFGDGISIGSDGHVNIEVNDGSLYANADGVERNPYLELFSTETTFGSSDTSADSVLTFEGSGSVTAGQNAYQWVDIDDSGTITSDLAGYGNASQLSDKYSSRASLQAYIDELQALVDEYQAWTETSTSNDGDKTDGSDDSGTGGGSTGSTETTAGSGAENPYTDEINALQTEIANLSVILNDLSEVENNVISVTGISASAGNVSLVADTIDLQGASGNRPMITARGDAYIDINNRDDQHLLVGNLYIANQTGGNVYVTGGASLDSSYITEENSTTTGVSSGIHVTHNPVGSNQLNSDVIVYDDITNLLSSVNITLEEGDLLQQAAIEANTINLTVENGSLVVNAGSAELSYGRSPLSLVNFTDKWKPTSADDFVHYWINDYYETQIDAVGMDEFNNWFYSCATAHGCKIGGTSYNNENAYFDNPSDDNADYNKMHLFFNWGFSNSEEYTGSDAVDLEFKTSSDSRGGRHWKFQPVYNKQSNLVSTASYSSVKSDIGAPGATIVGEKVVINAQRVDINGTIEVGKENNWSVTVGSGFDSAIQQYIAALGLTDGDQISLTPGQTLSHTYENPDYQPNVFQPGFDPNRYITQTFNPQIGKISGAENIALTYDVASGQLLVDDVPVSGGGFLSINAKISSTSQDGKILVRDGLGQINIQNYSNTDLVINSLDAGDDAVGIVRLTDHNFTKNMNDGGSTRDYYSHWYVHSPGGQIQEYETTSWATSYQDGSHLGASGGTGTTSSTTYNPLAGQLYYIREDATVSRSYTDFPDGYLAKYPNTVGDWQGTGAGGALEWDVEASYYTSCAANPGVCTNGTASSYIRQEYDADSIKRYWWNIEYSYSDYYGSNWTNTDPSVYIPYELNMETHTYVKADNAISISFNGVGSGSIDIDSNASVIIQGNIFNPLGTTDINTSGSLDAGSGSAFDADILRLYAGQGDLGTGADPLNITTDTVSLEANSGSVYFDITGKSGAVNLEQFSALYDVVGTVDKGLQAVGNGTHIQADTLNLTSYSGSIGSVGSIGDSASYSFINVDVNEITLQAADDIAIYQASGNLAVNTITASEDVVVKLGSGSLVNAIGQSEKSAEELAYLQTVWDALNLQDADAGAIAVTGYENQFTSRYHTYWLIKQRLDDDSDAGFAINSAFMETFKSRYGVGTDAEAIAAAKAEYQGLESWFDDQVVAPDVYANPENAIGIEQKGTLEGYDYGDLFTGGYDSSYQLVIDESSGWYADLTDGAQWSQSQLDISINAAALNADAQAIISSREANIVAPNVHIDVSGGSVGEDLADLVFSIDRNNPVITDAQKIALLEAGPGDIETTENGSLVTFRVSQVDPLKLDTTGVLNISATDEIYAESASGLTLGSIVSSTSDVRLAVNGSINSTSGTTNISARDLFIANTQGDIGTAANAIQVALTGALRQAGAANNLYLSQVGGDLLVDAVSAGGTTSLVSSAAIYGLDGDSVVSGDVIELVAGGDIGDSSLPLNLRMSGGGDFSIDAASAWLNIADTSAATLTAATLSGALSLDASGNLIIDGGISAAALDLYAAGDILDNGGYTISVTDLAKLEADHIDVDALQWNIGRGDFDATAGSMTLGNVTASKGDLDLLATGDLQLNGILDIAYTTPSAGGNARLLADAQNIFMGASASVLSETDITMIAIDAMDLQSLSANGAIDLTALNLLDSSRGSINAVLLNGASVSADAQAALTLGNVVGGAIDLRGDTILVSGDLQTTSSVSATAVNGAEFQGNIGTSAARTASITLDGGSGDVALGGDTYSSGLFRVAGGNLFTLASGSELLADAIDVTANGVSADVDSRMVSSAAADFALGAAGARFGEVFTSAALTIDAAGDVDFLNHVIVGSAASPADLMLQTSGDVTVADNILLDVYGALRGISGTSALANRWSMGGGSSLHTGASLGITTGADQFFGDLLIGGAMLVNVGGNIAFNGSGDIASYLNVIGSGNLALNGDVAVGTAGSGFLSIDVNGQVSQAAGQQLNGSDYILANAGGWTMGLNSRIHSDDEIAITSSGSMLMALLDAGDYLHLNAAAGSLFLTQNVSAANALNLLANDTVSVGYGVVAETSGGDLRVQARQLNAEMDSQLRSGGAANFTLGTDGGQFGELVSSGALTIDSQGALTFLNDVSVGTALAPADMQLSAAGAVSLADNILLDIRGALRGVAGDTAIVSSWSAASGSLLQTAGDMKLQSSSGGLQFAQLNIGGGAELTAADDLLFAESGVVADALNIVDADDVIFFGDVSVGNATTLAGISLNARGDVTQIAGQQLVGYGDILAAANSWNMGADALLQSANGIVDIQVGDGLTLENIDTANGLNLVAGGAIGLNAAVISGGNISIDGASLAMSSDASVDGNGNFVAVTSGAQTFDALSVDGTMEITAGGEIAFNDTAEIGNVLTVHDGQNLDLIGNVSVGGAALFLGGDVTQYSGQQLVISGNLFAQANSWIMESSALLQTGGDLQMESVSGDLQFAQLDIGGAAELTAAGGLHFNELGSIAGALTIIDANDVAFISDISVGNATTLGGVSLNARGDVTQIAGTQLVGYGDILAAANGWSMGAGALLQSTNGIVDIQVNNELTLENIDAANGFNLVAGGAIGLNAAVISGGNISVDGASLAMASDASVDGNGNFVAMTSGAQTFDVINVDGNLEITAGDDIAFNDTAEIGNVLTIHAGKNLDLIGNVFVGTLTAGDATLVLSGDVTQSAGQQFVASGNITAGSHSWAMGDNGLLQSGGYIGISTLGDMNMARVDSALGLFLQSIAGGIELRERAAVGGNSDLIAQGAVALSDSAAYTGAGGLTVDANSLLMKGGSSLTLGGDLIVSTGADQQFARLDIGGDTRLAAGGDLAFSDTANLTGTLSVTDADNLALLGNLYAGASDIALRGDFTQAAGIAFVSSGDITASAASWEMGDNSLLHSDGAIALDSAGDISLYTVEALGGLNLDSAQGAIALRDQVTAGDSIGITAAGAVDLFAGKVMATGGDFSLTADSFAMGDGALLQAAGTTYIHTANGQHLYALESGGDAQLNAGGDWTLVDSLQVDGDLSLQSGGAIGFGGDGDIAGDAQINAVDGLQLDVGRNLVVGKGLTAQAAIVRMGGGSLLQTGAATAITSGGDMVLAQVLSGGNTSLISGGSLRFNERAEVAGDLQLSAAAEVVQAQAQHLTVQGDLAAAAGSWQMLADSRLLVLNDADIALGGAATLQQVNTSGGLSLSSGAQVDLQRDIHSGGDIGIYATGNLTLAENRSVNAGGAVALDTKRWTMGAHSGLYAGGPIAIASSESMLLAELRSSWSGDYAFDLRSGGAISGRAETDLHLAASSGGKSYLQAATGIGDPLVVDLPWFSAQTDEGSINLVLVNDAHAELLSAVQGEVRLRAFGDLRIGELIGTPHLWIDGFLLARAMTIPKGTFIAGEGLQLDLVNLTTSGPLVARGPSIDMNIDSLGSAETFLTLTGLDGAAANWIGVNVDNTRRLNIDRLYTDYGAIRTSGDLRLERAEVFSQLDMESGELTLSLNNLDLSPRDVSGQLVTPYGEFWLDTRSNLLFTNAQVTRYRSPLVLTYQGAQGEYREGELGFSRLSMEYLLENEVRGEKANGCIRFECEFEFWGGGEEPLVRELDPEEFGELEEDVESDYFAEIELDDSLASRD